MSKFLLAFNSGMYKAALGNAFLAALKSEVMFFLMRVGLVESLSLMPNDRITVFTSVVRVVLCLRKCAACAIFAPGKEST